MNFLKVLFFMTITSLGMFSCSDDDVTLPVPTTSFQYTLHTGQAVPTAPYGGTHNTDFTASMNLTSELDSTTLVSVTLNNTIDGETYNIHAHDAADAATTANGTPYTEAPNGEIFAQMVVGNGGSVTVTQVASMGFTSLTTEYNGFFVVHDPLQDVSTTDITTFLVVGAFAR